MTESQFKLLEYIYNQATVGGIISTEKFIIIPEIGETAETLELLQGEKREKAEDAILLNKLGYIYLGQPKQTGAGMVYIFKVKITHNGINAYKSLC